MRRLAEHGIEGVAAMEAAVVDHPSLVVRAQAAAVLGTLGDERSRQALERATRDPSARVRVEAAASAVRLGSEAALAVLIDELDGAFFADAPVRAAAALGSLGDARGWPRVRAALESEDAAERMEGVQAAVAFRGVEGCDPDAAVRRLIDDPEPIVARDARIALGMEPG